MTQRISAYVPCPGEISLVCQCALPQIKSNGTWYSMVIRITITTLRMLWILPTSPIFHFATFLHVYVYGMRRGDGKRKPQIFLNRVSVVPIPFLSGGLLKRARERERGRPNGAIKGNEEMAAAGLRLPPFPSSLPLQKHRPTPEIHSTPAQVVSSRRSLSLYLLFSVRVTCYLTLVNSGCCVTKKHV